MPPCLWGHCGHQNQQLSCLGQVLTWLKAYPGAEAGYKAERGLGAGPGMSDKLPGAQLQLGALGIPTQSPRMPQQGFKPAPQHGHSSARGCMGQGTSSARWDQHSQSLEQEKMRPQTQTPALGISWVISPRSPGSLHPYVSPSPLPLERQFPLPPRHLKTAASSPMTSIMQTPTTTWFCSQLNAP